jgi:hypothetical protein
MMTKIKFPYIINLYLIALIVVKGVSYESS